MDKYVKLIDICEANDCFNEKHDCDTCIFNKIPAADVQPVRHGRWIISNIYAQCSECSVAYDLDTFQRLIPMNENMPRHCSYCGARMIKDGDKE